MADEANSTPETPTEAPQSDSEQTLGDGGKKALDAERRARSKAEREAKELKAQLDQIAAANLSKEEKAQRERDEAIAEAQQARAEALRYRIATKFGISDEDADLFLTGSDEETITRQAERLAERDKKPEGLYVPAEGHAPSAPALNSDELETSLRKKLGIPI